ncbi:MAG: hypothetical protein EXS05_11225 [Planctomycetaceae bacterium]|nr:hypothetical protein [Planctomycetaceae bacterium]
MFKSFELENYRGFERYRVRGLERVNLLVGKNNCGKTSVLEAVHLLAAAGEPSILQRIAWRRGEVVFVDLERERYKNRRDAFPDATHFFYGHQLGQGVRFCLSGNDGARRLEVEVVPADSIEPQQRLFDDTDGIRQIFALKIKSMTGASGLELAPLPLTESGALAIEEYYRQRRPTRTSDDQLAPVHFLTVESLSSDFMGAMWDKVLADKREQEVFRAMQVLAPSLEDIAFQTGERGARVAGPGSVLVGFKGAARRVPLGSLGDGMRRLLALSLALVRCERGVLLIDEIDTGLHYSVMADMWRLVIDAARNTDIQVFATTHSLDCLRGLTRLCGSRPDLATEVCVQKIEPSLDESVPLDAEQLRVAGEQEIEVR